MQQWEFRFVMRDWHDERSLVSYIDGRRQAAKGVQALNFFEYIRFLGEEGWELVGIANLDALGVEYSFKRAR